MVAANSSAPQHAGTAPSRISVFEMALAALQTNALVAAVELDLFTAIGRGDSDVQFLAKSTGNSSRGLRIVLDLLARIGFLDKNRGLYTLSPLASQFLSTDSPDYIGGMVLAMQSQRQREEGHLLAQTVRTGKPPEADPGDLEQFFAQLVDPLFKVSAVASDVAARAICGHSGRRGLRVLDIGAGSGVWSIAIARRDSHSRVTVVDSPVVIEKVTRRFTAREGVAEQYDYLPGNFREVPFEESAYDVAVLGHICHGEGQQRSRELFGRIHRALKPGGQLLIAEIVPDDERSNALFPLLFAVNMLASTPDGDTFTLSEYREWLQAAGFGEVITMEAPAPSPLIFARKP